MQLLIFLVVQNHWSISSLLLGNTAAKKRHYFFPFPFTEKTKKNVKRSNLLSWVFTALIWKIWIMTTFLFYKQKWSIYVTRDLAFKLKLILNSIMIFTDNCLQSSKLNHWNDHESSKLYRKHTRIMFTKLSWFK